MALTDQQLGGLSQGPWQTEQRACDDTVRAITNALSRQLGTRVTVFANGSYRNRTNVRQESDVDVVVLSNEAFFYDTSRSLPGERTRIAASTPPSPFSYAAFKAEVHAGLVGSFGAQRVQRRNKCILVRETATRVNADVVSAWPNHRYDLLGAREASGIAFTADDGTFHPSFPEQHFHNGEEKNNRASREYKRVVRILKRLRHRFEDAGNTVVQPVASFAIECALYNVPGPMFAAFGYRERMRNVLTWLHTALSNEASIQGMVEVNELQKLFRGRHNPEALRGLVVLAWREIGL